MSAKIGGEVWIACDCADPKCTMVIPLQKVLPTTRNAKGEIEMKVGPNAGRALCPRCGLITIYSAGDLRRVHLPANS